jgi:hypothetical protein
VTYRVKMFTCVCSASKGTCVQTTVVKNEVSVQENFLPSFPSALQLRVSFGLLNNLPPFFSEVDCLVSEQFSFCGVRLLASRPTPNLEDQDIPLRLAPTP